MKKYLFMIIASLALFTGRANAQRCLPKMQGIEVRANVAKQLWYDFGLGKGGDIFTLAGEFVGSGNFMEQVKFIAETARVPFAAMEKPQFLPKP